MIKSIVTPQDVVNLLNDALEKDPQAIRNLFGIRVFCGSGLIDHPTIQCWAIEDLGLVGIIGLLNGVFGEENGEGIIQMQFKSDGMLEKFKLDPNIEIE